MTTKIGPITLPFATKFTLSSLVSAVANLVGQYNFTSASVITLIFEKEYSDGVPEWAESAMNSSVFGGAVVGMLTLGYVGDVVGRRRAMAITLTIMVLSSFASCFFVWGNRNTVIIMLSVFRFFMGIGIGGVRELEATAAVTAQPFVPAVGVAVGPGGRRDRLTYNQSSPPLLSPPPKYLPCQVYPLSAAASYENDEGSGGDYGQRLRNVAWAQAWQQPGQMVPFVVAMCLFGTFYTRYLGSQFRLIMFFGGMLTVAPLYSLLNKGRKPKPKREPVEGEEEVPESTAISILGLDGISESEEEEDGSSSRMSIIDLLGQVGKMNKGKEFAGICLCWFCSDFYSYGTSMYGPELMVRSYEGNLNLVKDYRFNIISVAATFPTTWLSILAIGRIGTKEFQLLGFGVNCLLFLLTAMIYSFDTGLTSVAKFSIIVVLRSISRFGATTSTFVMPSELFGAEVRASATGFAAACGKTGAFISVVITPGLYQQHGVSSMLYLYTCIAALGYVLTYYLIPEIDRSDNAAKEAAVKAEVRVNEAKGSSESVPLVGSAVKRLRSHVKHGN